MAKMGDSTFPLCAYLDEIVAELRKEIPAALDDHEHQAIHKSRVATRRLKAALDLLEPVITPANRKNFARVLKKLRDRLGVERDLDVMLRHLDELEKHQSFADAVEWVHDAVHKKRDRRRAQNDRKTTRAEMLRRLMAWTEVRGELSDCGEAVTSLLSESLHLQLEAFAERATRLNGGAPGDEIHKLRLAGKRLRYTLEMAEQSGHPLAGGIMSAFKQMQEDLGLWHDYVELTHRIISTSASKSLPQQDLVLQEEVMRLADETIRRAKQRNPGGILRCSGNERGGGISGASA